MVHKWGISRTGNCGEMGFGVKKSVFLHQKLPHVKFSAQMRHFQHRKTGVPGSSASKRVFSCTKSCFWGKMVHKLGISRAGNCGAAGFGVRKSVFLHQKLPPVKFSAQMGHFLHRKLWRGGVRRQKECFPAPKVATREVRCTNGAFPAPEIVAQPVSASKRVFSCTKVATRGKWCTNEAFPAPEDWVPGSSV